MAACILWERVLVPCLMVRVGTWIGHITKAVELAETLQYYYWRSILAIDDSVPKIAIIAEMYLTGFKWGVWLGKC